MSQTFTIEQAAGRLEELLRSLGPDDEIILTRDDKPVGKLTHAGASDVRPREPGLGKGMLVILKEDDEHLDDFREYMP